MKNCRHIDQFHDFESDFGFVLASCFVDHHEDHEVVRGELAARLLQAGNVEMPEDYIETLEVMDSYFGR